MAVVVAYIVYAHDPVSASTLVRTLVGLASHRRAGRSETITSSSGGGRWEQDHASGTSPDGLPRVMDCRIAMLKSCWLGEECRSTT
jgi:hypothetical protein